MHLPLCNIEQISFGCDGGAGVRGSSIERNHPGSWAVLELLLASDEVCVVLFLLTVGPSLYIIFEFNAGYQAEHEQRVSEAMSKHSPC